MKYAFFSQPNNAMVLLYFLLRLIVTAVLLLSLLYGRYDHAGFCVLSLLLFLLPEAVSRRFRITLPHITEALFLLFIFASEILGELGQFYLRFPHWDTLLHTIGGLLSTALGFSVIRLFHHNDTECTPLFCAASVFCFSMTVGIFWEFFEFGMDTVFHTNMQKDRMLYRFSTPCLDIGLYDTMGDLLTHALSTAFLCGLGFLHIRSPKPNSFAEIILPLRQDFPK